MKSTILAVLLALAMAMMITATELPGDPTSATVTVTVTEPVCMTGSAGDATPLSIANVLATVDGPAAAASLIASMMMDSHDGGTVAPAATVDTTTVTTVANATNCPASPTFDVLNPTGLFASYLNEDLNNTNPDNNNTGANVPGLPSQHWSQGRNSLCFTNSDYVATGKYGIYLDGWGQEKDGCGKGILDNLRGQCGWIMSWGCRPWGSGVVLTFYVSGARYSKCVLDGIWMASPKDKREEGLCCVYLGNSLIHYNDC